MGECSLPASPAEEWTESTPLGTPYSRLQGNRHVRGVKTNGLDDEPSLMYFRQNLRQDRASTGARAGS